MATDSSLLLGEQERRRAEQQSTLTASTLAYTLQNQSALQSTIQGQLATLQSQRADRFRPFYPDIIPSSVTQLEMATRNVGVPFPVFTMADCQRNRWMQRGQ